MPAAKIATFTEIAKHGAYSRSGELVTRRGVIRTPVFMPVGTRGAVKTLTPELVRSTGASVILGNTYHLHLRPGEEVVAALGGLHGFSRWDGPILTDSGGFQVFSLSQIRKINEEGVTFKDPVNGDTVLMTPEKSIQIQLKLGADIIMAFDDLTGLGERERSRTGEAVERTHRWLERSIAEFRSLTVDMPLAQRPLLFGIAQGGLDEALRRRSLEYVKNSDVDGIAIGGLSVGETRSEMHAMLDLLAPLYDHSRPRYLMGVGDPRDMRHALERGIDMFDCVLPTRNARHGSAWISGGTGGDNKILLKNEEFLTDPRPLEAGCDCYACTRGFSRGFLRHQFKVNEPLAGALVSVHNLRYLQRICEAYRS